MPSGFHVHACPTVTHSPPLCNPTRTRSPPPRTAGSFAPGGARSLRSCSAGDHSADVTGSLRATIRSRPHGFRCRNAAGPGGGCAAIPRRFRPEPCGVGRAGTTRVGTGGAAIAGRARGSSSTEPRPAARRAPPTAARRAPAATSAAIARPRPRAAAPPRRARRASSLDRRGQARAVVADLDPHRVPARRGSAPDDPPPPCSSALAIRFPVACASRAGSPSTSAGSPVGGGGRAGTPRAARRADHARDRVAHQLVEGHQLERARRASADPAPAGGELVEVLRAPPPPAELELDGAAGRQAPPSPARRAGDPRARR